MRAVIDTNVLLSGLIWRGTPRGLIEQVRVGALSLVSSPFILAELGGDLTRPKFRTILARSKTNPERILMEIRLMAEIVVPPPLVAPVCRDPDDDEVLALAEATLPDFIASGDGDLLVLGSHAGIPILTPAEALAAITASWA